MKIVRLVTLILAQQYHTKDTSLLLILLVLKLSKRRFVDFSEIFQWVLPALRK